MRGGAGSGQGQTGRWRTRSVLPCVAFIDRALVLARGLLSLVERLLALLLVAGLARRLGWR